MISASGNVKIITRWITVGYVSAFFAFALIYANIIWPNGPIRTDHGWTFWAGISLIPAALLSGYFAHRRGPTEVPKADRNAAFQMVGLGMNLIAFIGVPLLSGQKPDISVPEG